jgi:hypothetical protein
MNIFCFIYIREGYPRLNGYKIYRGYAMNDLGVVVKYAVGEENIVKEVLMGSRSRQKYYRLYPEGYNLIWVNTLNDNKDDFIDNINEIDNKEFKKAYKKFQKLYHNKDSTRT